MKRCIRRRRRRRRVVAIVQAGDDVARFTADTAAMTGKPERTIQRDATGAKALGSDLDRVAGTSLDKGAELDALTAMPAAVWRLDPSRQLSQWKF